MQKTLLIRVVVIGLLMMLLMIPLQMIFSIVAERQGLQSHVEHNIATSLAGPQRLAAPLLVVPYVEREIVTETSNNGRVSHKTIEHHRQSVFIPEKLTIDIAADVESRYKGIYKALVYQSKGRLTAQFNIPTNLGLEKDPAMLTIGKAWLAIGLTDPRGLRATPAMQWDGQSIPASTGTGADALGNGFSAAIGIPEVRHASQHTFALDFEIAGTRSLAIVPIGETTIVQLKSPWPHPNFGGRFLPRTKHIDDAGFSARWEVSQLATRNGDLIRKNGISEREALESLDVSFIEPVNTYLLAERAVKYGMLFVALTFATFFLFETLKNLRIHPLQYGLVGLALAVFFLLLVSLSEHVSFALAYAIASFSCVLLIGYYVSHVLGGWRRGVAFSAKLVLLYVVLYGLLLSEDNALMLGAILLFIVLGIVMILTRKLDWYSIGSKTPAVNS